MVSMRVLIILLAGVSAAAAQDAPRGNWQTPGEIQKPSGNWQVPGAIQVPGAMQAPGPVQKAGEIQQPGEIQEPKGPWITPGEIAQPKGPWIKPGEIQVPKGIEAVRVTSNGCENRLSVFADALFDFDKASLRPDAEATLRAALPEIAKAQGKPAYVEGHTDGKGSDAYNMKLSEARGRTVRDWLGANGAIPAATPIKAYGKRMPIAPNTTPDGQDDPEGRQKNRRVEIVFETCKS
jgi:outer membrane protein OmpA-like peptidoglycan-associated protein